MPNVERPRDRRGRWLPTGANPPTPASHTQPTVHNPTSDPGYAATHQRFTEALQPPDDVLQLVDEIAAEAEYIEFPDHSGVTPEGDDAPWVTLADLHDNPKLCGNNCHAVTYEVSRTIVETVGYEGAVSEAEIVFQNGVHWANTVTDPDGNTWVLDYTARQFDPDVPVPYVTTPTRWVAWVSDRVREQHGDIVQEINL